MEDKTFHAGCSTPSGIPSLLATQIYQWKTNTWYLHCTVQVVAWSMSPLGQLLMANIKLLKLAFFRSLFSYIAFTASFIYAYWSHCLWLGVNSFPNIVGNSLRTMSETEANEYGIWMLPRIDYRRLSRTIGRIISIFAEQPNRFFLVKEEISVLAYINAVMYFAKPNIFLAKRLSKDVSSSYIFYLFKAVKIDGSRLKDSFLPSKTCLKTWNFNVI